MGVTGRGRSSNGTGIRLPLHHVNGPCSPVNYRPVRFEDTVKQDEARVLYLLSRLSGTGSFPQPDAFGVPVESGGKVGTGNFVVGVGLGTPAKDYVMIADTGSTFTWLQCQPCSQACHPQAGPVFDPSSSSTYESVSCGEDACTGLQEATLNPSGCSSQNKCEYEASYGDRSLSIGFVSRDTLSVGSESLPGFLYGCGQLNQGLFGQTAGIIGLSRDKYSLFAQLGSKYGNVFSYCLPTPSSTGTLSFGAGVDDQSAYQFTPMRSSSRDQALYFLQLTGISVAGQSLPVSTAEYTRQPTLIDSGTVITRLPDTVYAALRDAFVKQTAGYPKAEAFSLLDTCLQAKAKDVAVPEVVMHFEGGSELKLEAWNVLMDVADGQSCLAFAGTSMSEGVAIIGNRQQQKTTVVYDVSNSRIGFANGGCG
ncbi:ASPARTIC PROTEASE IN GUARD CELL 2 protein [Nymphaea thermarum]|nr:ASPARTIC PROTEASE IN GUARD CELL 2 protein [Nymphaea thermarum]